MDRFIKIDKIRDYIKENNLTKQKFCTMSKIGNKTLNKILNGDIDISIKILIKIARAMEIELAELLQ